MISLSREVWKVSKAFLTESGLETFRCRLEIDCFLQLRLLLNNVGWPHYDKPQLMLYFSA